MAEKLKVTNAVGWSAIDVIVSNGLAFLILMIMARILSPTDFGLMAMLAIFANLGSLLIDGGFSQGLIQRQRVTHIDESSIFFVNLIMAGIVSLILCISAPWIASFYGKPELRDLVFAMTLNLMINAFSSVHTALLEKKLDYKTIAKTNIVAKVIGGASAIAAAAYGLGVWSLMLQLLSVSLVSAIMLWAMHPWRPAWVLSSQSILSFFKFSGYLMLSSLMYSIYGDIYAMLIGKYHSARQAGFYTQAQRLQQLPVILMTSIISRVTFSVFSASASDKQRMVFGLRRALAATVFMSVPIAVLLLFQAKPLVLILLGDQWLASVPVLQMLSLVAMLMPIQILNVSMLKALGRADLNFRIMVVKLILGLALLVLSLPYGIIVIAATFTCTNLVNLFINTYYTSKLLEYGIGRQLRDILPYIVASLPMIIVILGLHKLIAPPYQIELLLSLMVGGGVYLLTCRFAKLDVLDDLFLLVKRRT